MHRQFIKEIMEKVDKEKTWQWLSRDWNRSIVVCHSGAGNQDKLYEVPMAMVIKRLEQKHCCVPLKSRQSGQII